MIEQLEFVDPITEQIMTEIKIQIEAGSKVSMESVTVEDWNDRRAARLGLRWCLGTWAAGLMTIILPIVHFLTVPSRFFGGPLLGFLVFRYYRHSTDIISGQAKCPVCGSTFKIEPQTVDWPFYLKCATCSAEVGVTRC